MGRLVAVLLLAAAAVSAADLTGVWMGSTTSGRRNQVADFAFRFEEKAGVLTGKMYLDYGSVPILQGTVEGDKFSFEVVAREQNGNEINEAVFRFTGTVKDGEIEIKRERVGIRNVGNAGAAFSRAGELTFKLKRLP